MGVKLLFMAVVAPLVAVHIAVPMFLQVMPPFSEGEDSSVDESGASIFMASAVQDALVSGGSRVWRS